MPEKIFEFSTGDLSEQCASYNDIIRAQFYGGEFSVASPARGVTLSLERGATYPVSTFSVQSGVNTQMRRSRKNIRTSEPDVYLLWLLNRGRLRITDTSGLTEYDEGTVALTSSRSPALIEGLVSVERKRNHIVALIPAQLLRAFLPDTSLTRGIGFSMQAGDGKIVASLFQLMHEEGENMDRGAASALFGEAVNALSRLCGSALMPNPRKSVADRRLSQIDATIEQFLSDSDLSAERVAASCEISVRYFFQLLKSRGTTFGKLLWDKRRERAREWLVAEMMRGVSIGEIAAMAGYKRASHFSSHFKELYGRSPRQYRDSNRRSRCA